MALTSILETTTGFQVVSEKGKPLSKPNLTKEQAQERVRQLEYFVAMKRKSGSNEPQAATSVAGEEKPLVIISDDIIKYVPDILLDYGFTKEKTPSDDAALKFVTFTKTIQHTHQPQFPDQPPAPVNYIFSFHYTYEGSDDPDAEKYGHWDYRLQSILLQTEVLLATHQFALSELRVPSNSMAEIDDIAFALTGKWLFE